MTQQKAIEPMAPWATQALQRVEGVLNMQGVSPTIIDAAHELHETIVKQSAMNFVYETQLAKTAQQNPLEVVQAQVEMNQLIDELNSLVDELEQEARK